MESIDVAVVGLGGIGSAAAWFAAGSGASVIGFERFALGGHHRGASHDHSRIIRHSYHTAHYVELTFDAYDAWRAVEQASGETCVHVTGGVDLFPAAAAIDIDTYRAAMRACDVPFDELSGAEVRSRWPAFTVDDGVRALYQQATGIVSPATTVALMQQLAMDAGAMLRGGTVVRALEPQADGSVLVVTDGGVARAAHVIIAADAWTAPLLSPLGVQLPLVVTKEQVTYYDTVVPQRFAMGRLPVWIWMDDPSFYGFPTFGRPGVKVAEDCGGQPVDPDGRGFEPDPAISARTDAFVADIFGGAVGPAAHTTTCLYTLTTDRDFVVDTVTGLPITIALGAGHGYKFAAWFGRTLARLAAGVDPGCDLTPFRLDRPVLRAPAARSGWLV
jgi:sarcosine oxidase